MTLDPRNFSEGQVFMLAGKSAFDVSPDVLPANSVQFIYKGGNWGGTWFNLGYASPDGVAHGGLSPDTTPQMTSQQRGSAALIKGAAAQTVSFSLLELTALVLQYALGAGTLTSDAFQDELEFTDDPPKYFALGIEAVGPNGKPLRMIYPAMSPNITGDIVNTIGTNAMIPVQFTRAGSTLANPKWRWVK